MDFDLDDLDSDADLGPEVEAEAEEELDSDEPDGTGDSDSDEAGDDSDSDEPELKCETTFTEPPSELDPEAFVACVDSAVALYDQELLDGLEFHYLPEQDPEQPEMLGFYSPGEESITLCDHAPDAEETLHHEIGHHITGQSEDLRSRLFESLSAEGFVARHSAFLALYPKSSVPDESCAEAFAMFAGNDAAFEENFPMSAEILREVRRG
jgi:hypothetical protein